MKIRPPRHYILDADNHAVEVNFLTWAIWFEDADRRVGYTQITSHVEVSTIFLGLDHRHLGDGPPILFETMVFGGPLDGDGGRYSSYDDAEVGHRMMVAKVRAAMGQRVTND
jgi:hypothetical protein